jgi:hypothetical protein
MKEIEKLSFGHQPSQGLATTKDDILKLLEVKQPEVYGFDLGTEAPKSKIGRSRSQNLLP